MYNTDGSLTRYALACGRTQSHTADGAPFYGTDAPGVALSWNGCTYDVRTRDESGAYSWDQYNTLTEARRAFARAAKYGGTR